MVYRHAAQQIVGGYNRLVALLIEANPISGTTPIESEA